MDQDVAKTRNTYILIFGPIILLMIAMIIFVTWNAKQFHPETVIIAPSQENQPSQTK